ncbi:MAG: hypothetical protein OEW15_13110 [Nitrospirota bacterium]|nr:hypothetical protein [Nitrospirota bacterium]
MIKELLNRVLLAVSLFTALNPCPAGAVTLQEGLTIVTEQGRDASLARADVQAAREALSLSRSPYLPTVDIYARETWLKDQPETKTPGGSFPMSQDLLQAMGRDLAGAYGK